MLVAVVLLCMMGDISLLVSLLQSFVVVGIVVVDGVVAKDVLGISEMFNLREI